MEGRIIKAIAGFYYVHNGEEAYELGTIVKGDKKINLY